MTAVARHNPNAVPIAEGFHAHLGHRGVYFYRHSPFEHSVYVPYDQLPAFAAAVTEAVAFTERQGRQPAANVPPDPDEANLFSPPVEASRNPEA